MTTTTTTNNDESTMYKELIDFLKSNDRLDIQIAATQAIYQVTEESQMKELIRHGVIEPLVKLCSNTTIIKAPPTTTNDATTDAKTTTTTTTTIVGWYAIKCLIQLSSSSISTTTSVSNMALYKMLDYGCISRLMELILTISGSNTKIMNWRQIIYWCCSIIANLTRMEKGCIELLIGEKISKKTITLIEKLQQQQQQQQNNNNDTMTASFFILQLLLERFINSNYYLIQEKEEEKNDEQEQQQQKNNNTNTNTNTKNLIENYNHSNYNDPYQHVSSIIMNLIQIDTFRITILPKLAETNELFFNTLLWEQIKPSKKPNDDNNNKKLMIENYNYKNNTTIRRCGITGMIRNCCSLIGIEEQKQLKKERTKQTVKLLTLPESTTTTTTTSTDDGDDDDDNNNDNSNDNTTNTNTNDNEKYKNWWIQQLLDNLTILLYPLAGPEQLDIDEKQGLDVDLWIEGPDKKRETNNNTRLYIVETILWLCAQGIDIRNILRKKRIYVILKYCDMVEENEIISEKINDCVQFIRRDEINTEEGSSDSIIFESLNKLSLSKPITSNNNNNTNSDDDEDDDDYDAVD